MLVVDRNDKINAVKHDGVPDEAVQGERQYWRNIDVQPRHIELTRPCLPCFIAYHWGLFDVCARVCVGAASQAPVDTLRKSRVWRARRLVTC
mgnify:CR=1 FL=1